jgi:hypothetical protein
MPSIIDIIKETSRQAITKDDSYAKLEPYFFVLRGPALKSSLGFGGGGFFEAAGGLSSATFPLPLNPISLTYTMPFAAEVTPLQQGGAITEEDGIHIGNIVIEATTGFRLKPIQDTSLGGSSGEFTGELGKRGFSGLGNLISGQMHFWRLANRCFDAYSELKKDPQTAHKTSMEFHSQKDDLHLKVVPTEFVLTREPEKNRVTYGYRVSMDVIGAAGRVTIPSPDEDLLTKLKNGISSIRKGIQAVAATIDDVTAALDEIGRTLSNVASIINDVKSVLDAFEALVEGTVSFVSIPKRFIVGLADTVEARADSAEAVLTWPPDVAQSFRSMGDELDRLTVAAQSFWVEDWRAKAIKLNERLRDPTVNSKQFSSGGGDSDSLGPPGTGSTASKVSDIFGGGTRDSRPGDSRRALVTETKNRLGPTEYNGFEEKVVGSGDTLPGLAAKHLGDARKWIDLAVANDLKPPYITTGAKIPYTLSVGSKLIVPITTARVGADTLTDGGGRAVGKSQAEEALGEDFYLAQQKDVTGKLANSFGWRIDTRSGSVDVMKVSGVNNFGQALEMRFRTIQGENILYPAIGLPRLVGKTNLGSTVVSAEYGASQQLLADKRTERVVSFNLSVETDAVVLDAEIQPVGFDGSRTIQRTLT